MDKNETQKECTGIVLAGGKSSRMGVDKGLMKINKKPMIQYIIDALYGITDNILIVSDNREYNKFGVLCVEDEIKNYGPLSGLYSGLKASTTEINFVVGCDTPLLSTNLLKRIYAEKKAGDDAVIIANDEYLMPLIGIYLKSKTIEKLNLLINKGEKKMSKFIEIINSKIIYMSEEEKIQSMNINTKDVFDRVKKILV